MKSKNLILRHLIVCGVLTISLTLIAQPPQGPLVISPQVHADKKVTFRYLSPFAKQVLQGGEQFGASQLPQGTITYEYYPSVEGSTGSLAVYTPPGYNKNVAKKYPVFYLINRIKTK